MAEFSPMLENPYTCKLTLVSPRGKGHVLEKILSSLTGWVDPSNQIINIEERVGPVKPQRSSHTKSKHGSLITPALSLMLFMKETGHPCARDIEKVLKKGPWSFHHKVELQCKNAPNTSLAKQEFYKLADDLPLFVVCPVLLDAEHLRINMYVRNFAAMVDFYRLITETEIETNKPEFCIFQIYRQPGLDIQLSLKRSQYIYPRPVESAYASFNVKNVDALGLHCEIIRVNGNVYSTRDPDGNLVVLYETSGTNQSTQCPDHGVQKVNVQQRQSCFQGSSASFDDVKSQKSMTESHDSGRYSDIDGHEDIRKPPLPSTAQTKKEVTLVSEVSEGYASSEDTKDDVIVPSENDKTNGVKRTTNEKNLKPPRGVKSEPGLKREAKRASSIKQKSKVTPVHM